MYATVNSTGGLVEETSVVVPTGYAPTPLLSLPVNNDYFTGLYPVEALPGSDVNGYLAFGDFQACCGTMTLQKITYYLVGAARLS